MARNTSDFVKIILLKGDNCALTLQKRLFCDAKPTLLPCKTAAFRMQNDRFCKVLVTRRLGDVKALKILYIFVALFPIQQDRYEHCFYRGNNM